MASEHGGSDDDQSEQEPQSTIIPPNPAYTLNNSDNPGTPLVSSTLNDNNYHFSIWEKVDSMVMAWIINMIDPNLNGSISHASTAREIWIDLEDTNSSVMAHHMSYAERF
ncbi:hypothetical protein KIW84_035181 [Lathyrus oleraceus]|uniref:Retrotransposon Copia-like N-terminal domain-containing protein n=1 Tax=Pisum sativum TaxID=3888 RepID=A0A9D4Y5Y1_PEA|nr:hypothetical protein KIW84_035181 [Pisum sativum]